MNKNIARMIIAAFILSAMLILANKADAALSCNVTTSCDYTDVFHMSNVTDAHAELRNNSDYSYKVCCRDTANRTISTGCGYLSTTLLHLSGETDAHAEQANESDYSFNVCMNTTIGNISYGYTDNCTTAGYDSCLASISTNITGKSTDLHVADCVTDPYATKICVSLTEKGVIPTTFGATPFYTTSANPQPPENVSCLRDMKGGDKCNVTWSVVPTGPLHSVWQFFAIFTPLNYSAYLTVQQSNKVNITISGDVAPTISAPAISPTTAYTNDSLNCSWTITDPDTTNVSANVTWYKNGALNETEAVNCTAGAVCGTRNVIQPSFTTKGQVWNCSVFAYDNASLSANKSVAITISNSVPAAPIINLTPDAPITANDLYCNVTTNSTDTDNDTVNYTYTWRKDNAINRTFGPTNQLYDIIGSGNTSKNNVWNCTVAPFDGAINGTTASDKATIANTAPTHTTPVLSSSAGTNYTNESLTCYNQSTNDADNDAVTNYYKWFRNNTIVENETINTLNYGNFSKNDTVICEVIASDLTENSTALNSTALKILNYPPLFNKTINNITWNENTNLINNLTLSNYFYDIDNDDLFYNVTGNSSIRVVINSTTKNVSFYPAANWDGVEYIVFTAADDDYNASSNNITLTVGNVARCGDGTIDSGEDCEGSNLNGKSCATQGYDSGTLKCSSSCKFDTSSCATTITQPPVTATPTTVTAPAPAPTVSTTLSGLPCSNVTYFDNIGNLSLTGTNISKFAIPEGYEIALEPFSLNCFGESIDMTISIPDNFVNVTLLKCIGGICLPSIVEEVTELWCGEKIKEATRETMFLEPEQMPIEIKEKSQVIKDVKDALKSGNNSIQFIGKIFENITASVSMPKQTIEEAVNPSLKIVGTPLVLKLGIPADGQNLSTAVTMPYVQENIFENGSIAMYAKTRDGWEYIGGDLNEDDKTVTANVQNIGNYLDNESEATFALMGILCTYCVNSSLELVFSPEPKSRDAIILVHGLASSPRVYQQIIDDIRLTNQPFNVLTFGYPSSRSVIEIADEFSTLIEAKSSEFDNIYMVTHSLGGLIAQQALYKAYNENYNYVSKTKKIILAGVPNEGSPIIEVYGDLFRTLVNKKTDYSLFSLNSRMIDDLAKGIITPRVPGIEYFVIAGTRQPALNLLFFKKKGDEYLGTYNVSDGLVPVESAQHVGEGYIKDKCDNYWEVNLTHPSLINDPIARKLIGKIVAEEIFNKELVLLGSINYFNLKITECSPEEKYVVVGKRIARGAVYDPTMCSCGNDVCGEGEDEFNCPSDCAVFLEEKGFPLLLLILSIVLVLLLILLAYYAVTKYRKARLRKAVVPAAPEIEPFTQKEIIKPLKKPLTRLEKLENELAAVSKEIRAIEEGRYTPTTRLIKPAREIKAVVKIPKTKELLILNHRLKKLDGEISRLRYEPKEKPAKEWLFENELRSLNKELQKPIEQVIKTTIRKIVKPLRIGKTRKGLLLDHELNEIDYKLTEIKQIPPEKETSKELFERELKDIEEEINNSRPVRYKTAGKKPIEKPAHKTKQILRLDHEIASIDREITLLNEMPAEKKVDVNELNSRITELEHEIGSYNGKKARGRNR